MIEWLGLLGCLVIFKLQLLIYINGFLYGLTQLILLFLNFCSVIKLYFLILRNRRSPIGLGGKFLPECPIIAIVPQGLIFGSTLSM